MSDLKTRANAWSDENFPSPPYLPSQHEGYVEMYMAIAREQARADAEIAAERTGPSDVAGAIACAILAAAGIERS